MEFMLHDGTRRYKLLIKGKKIDFTETQIERHQTNVFFSKREVGNGEARTEKHNCNRCGGKKLLRHISTNVCLMFSSSMASVDEIF